MSERIMQGCGAPGLKRNITEMRVSKEIYCAFFEAIRASGIDHKFIGGLLMLDNIGITRASETGKSDG